MPNLPLLLGHRGARASRSVPENTLASFDLALRHGCDGFEFDVRLAGAERAIVCHDPKVGKITVSRATRRQLVHLPGLDDVLHRYAHRAFLNIELKVKGLETIVLNALREHQPERECVVSSFIPDVVMELKARSGIVPVGIICEKRSQLAHWNKLPIDYVMAHESLIDEALVQDIQAAGRRIFAWTVNDKRSMVRLAGWGIDGVISDDTQLLVRTLRPSKIARVPTHYLNRLQRA
jgi:glycerophosphoryl diester phosphodiesterase